MLFIPLIISSGGNSGSQSATLITRALAVGDVEMSQALRVIMREAGQGIALGAFLGLIGFGRAILSDNSFVTERLKDVGLVADDGRLLATTTAVIAGILAAMGKKNLNEGKREMTEATQDPLPLTRETVSEIPDTVKPSKKENR